MFAQAAFHLGHKNAQHRALQSRVALNKVAQPFGHGEHPLPHRERRKDVIDQVRRYFGHAVYARAASCPWQNGRVERFLGTLKLSFDQLVVDCRAAAGTLVFPSDGTILQAKDDP